MGYRLEEDNRIVINNVADLSLKKLDMLQNTELIDTVVIESELGRDEYDVEKYKEIYQSLIELTDGIDRNWSNLKKFILIYRRVSKLIEYDHRAKHTKRANKLEQKYKIKNMKKARNLENGLIKGKAVCKGYAEILRNACLMRGINAIKVKGRTTPNGRIATHSWNQVEIEDGVWIEVDPTWDHNSGIKYMGTDEKQFRKTHFYVKRGIPALIDAEEHATTEIDLNSFLNLELDLPSEYRYTLSEQNKLIELIEKRDVEGLDIHEELKSVLDKIEERMDEEGEIKKNISVFQSVGYINDDEMYVRGIPNRRKFNGKYNIKEINREIGKSVESKIKANQILLIKKMINQKGIGLHPDRIAELREGVQKGTITLDEAYKIIEYKKGQIDNIDDIRDTIVLRQMKKGALQFETECGYTIERLHELGFSTEEIKLLQRKSRIIEKKQLDIKIKDVVEEEIANKQKQDLYPGKKLVYGQEKIAEIGVRTIKKAKGINDFIDTNEYLKSLYEESMIAKSDTRRASYIVGKNKRELQEKETIDWQR